MWIPYIFFTLKLMFGVCLFLACALCFCSVVGLVLIWVLEIPYYGGPAVDRRVCNITDCTIGVRDCSHHKSAICIDAITTIELANLTAQENRTIKIIGGGAFRYLDNPPLCPEIFSDSKIIRCYFYPENATISLHNYRIIHRSTFGLGIVISTIMLFCCFLFLFTIIIYLNLYTNIFMVPMKLNFNKKQQTENPPEVDVDAPPPGLNAAKAKKTHNRYALCTV